MQLFVFCAGVLLVLVWLCVKPGRFTAAQAAPFSGVNYAHRGLYAQDQSVPENSLPAFAAAVENGYGMELDIQLSQDGEVVVFHDDTLARMCGIQGRVDAFALAQLREMPLAGTAEHMPLLTEVFDTVAGKTPIMNDFHVRKVMTNYLPNDEESKHYACLLQWDNIYYQPPTQEYISPKTTVRVGLVQWQMRSYKTLDDLFEQVEFFVDAVSDYKSDFVLFPEYFNAPLMSKYNDKGESQAIRGLAKYTDEIRERFMNLAISYNINIITGSMPYVKEDGLLYNVGFLCRRDGTYEMYEKLHVTPDEIKSWGLNGGKLLNTFDTDCAKIGVLICYDVEFPELSRLMADQGMQILFVEALLQEFLLDLLQSLHCLLQLPQLLLLELQLAVFRYVTYLFPP